MKKTLLLSLVLCSGSALAQERLEMEGTAIIGNKELPKVLYIVPWKAAEPVPLVTPPFNSVLDRSATPIERSSFKRRINFYNETYNPADSRP